MLGKTCGSAIAGIALACAAAAAESDPEIRAVDLRRHVAQLASDDFSGRETGTSGVERAESYIAAELARDGLGPLPGRADLFVPFELWSVAFDAAASRLAIDREPAPFVAAAGVDFRPFDFSDPGAVEAEVVFAGYGIASPEHDWDDYAGLDVRGKIVLVLRHEPREVDPHSSFDGARSTRHAEFREKVARARERGAAALILVTDPLHHDGADDLPWAGRLQLERPPAAAAEPAHPLVAVQASRAWVTELLRPAGLELAELQRRVDEGTRPSAFDLGGVRASVALARPAAGAVEVWARDVAAFLPGRDAKLRDEWIVVGAHHDHLGTRVGDGDLVFNGADDNASGTAGVLEIAQAFARSKERPRRSLVFVTFTAEEKGLLGSRALVEQRLVPPERVAFMLNLDMIGRNADQPIEAIGDGLARGLRPLVEQANAQIGLPLAFGGEFVAANSDHHPFYEQGVPFLFLFTGLHQDYHRPADDPDKLDYERMERITRLAHDVVQRVADADRPPTAIQRVDWLGLVVEAGTGRGRSKARITAVDQGSRAERAGLRAQDILVAVARVEVRDARDAGRRFRAVAPGVATTLEVRRDGERVPIEVRRPRPGALGIGLAAVDAEVRRDAGLGPDEGVRVGELTSGGAAEAAGLHPGDVLLSVGGIPVNALRLRGVLAQVGAGETVEVVVLRAGERIRASVTLDERS